jgi:tRNA A-37 threonylcarbamoyl transferase component Bud32
MGVVMIDVGQTVGNYKVTAKLGEGGMGMVFLAEHPVIGRKAALKAIHPEHARNAEVVSRFVNEAKSINQIGHEHIVEVTDFGRTASGDFYFIMEYLQGETLAELIAREAPLPPARAVAIAGQIADALEASHAHGVIHRDLKPDNIFMVPRAGGADFVKVLDFGLAKLLNGDAAYDMRAGLVMGTPYYMAPEQCEGRTEIDQRADIYALGVILFEMLTGKLPFGGDNCADILLKQITMLAPAARSIVPELPEALDVILHRALAKDPDERFATMAALRQVLLDPTSHVGARPQGAVHDDRSGRMRAAHPMTRAAIGLRHRRLPGTRPTSHESASPARSARTTFDESAGEVARDDEDELVPARNGGRPAVLVVAAALVGLTLAAGVTYGRAVQHTAVAASSPQPRTVTVSFGSDPEGATVVAADGTALGATPLSIEVSVGTDPVGFVFRRDGFQSKAMSIIPNVSASLFALMPAEVLAESQPAARTPDDDPPPLRQAASARRIRTHHARALEDGPADTDVDGVLAPSFLK